eukprot:gene32474-17709_t
MSFSGAAGVGPSMYAGEYNYNYQSQSHLGSHHMMDDDIMASHEIVVVTDSDPMLPDVCLEMSLGRDIVVDESEPLGEGAYGQVFKGQYLGMDVAVKFAQKFQVVDGPEQTKALETLQQEAKILSRVRHPNIVRFYGGSVAPPTVFIVEELMDKDLSNVAHAGDPLSLDDCLM